MIFAEAGFIVSYLTGKTVSAMSKGELRRAEKL